MWRPVSGIGFLRRLLPPKRRRRVDACILHNELDLLTIRIEELWDEVDYFVVVEANETFAGQPKPLFFEENRSHFKPYADKLVYRSITHLPPIQIQTEEARFAREAAQRDAINDAIVALPLSSYDIVVISDVDEIPRARCYERLETALARHDYTIFLLRNHRGYINNTSDAALNGVMIAGPVACRISTLCRVGAHQVRRGQMKSGGVMAGRSPRYHYMQDAGWHFSSLGGPDAFWLKAASFSHIDDPYRVISLGDTVPSQRVFRASLDRDQCRSMQARYLAHCTAPAFSPLDYDTFEIQQDVPAFLRREKERFRAFFFFTDLT